MWETEEREPGIGMILKLSEIFGCSTDALLGRPSDADETKAKVKRLCALLKEIDCIITSLSENEDIRRFTNESPK